MATERMKDIDLLLIGKTGNGKSATGNTILGFNAFESKFTMDSVTTIATSDVRDYHGRIIKVVDTPGVGDTRLDTDEGFKLVIDAMQKAIAMNTRGYHAFLLTVRFGGRFTQEDVDTVKFLKLIFGDDFVRKHCILIMTCGDNFKLETKGSGLTFTEWCEQQKKGVFKNIYDECESRILLFDNKADDEGKEEQLKSLIKVIDELWKPGHRYRDENFAAAQEAREKFLITAKEPQIKEEMMTETSLIMQEMAKIQTKKPKDQLQPLKDLLGRVDRLKSIISGKDKGTGALHKLLNHVEATKQTVRENINVCEEVIKIEERVEAQRILEKKQREEEKALGEMEKIKLQMERAKLLEEKAELEREKAQSEAEREKIKGSFAKLQKGYQELKKENESGIVETILQVATFPFKALARGFVSLFS